MQDRERVRGYCLRKIDLVEDEHHDVAVLEFFLLLLGTDEYPLNTVGG